MRVGLPWALSCILLSFTNTPTQHLSGCQASTAFSELYFAHAKIPQLDPGPWEILLNCLADILTRTFLQSPGKDCWVWLFHF